MPRLELSIERVKSGEIAGAWEVTAWRGSDYLGRSAFLFYSKRDALRVARETIKEKGGLGIYARA